MRWKFISLFWYYAEKRSYHILNILLKTWGIFNFEIIININIISCAGHELGQGEYGSVMKGTWKAADGQIVSSFLSITIHYSQP